MEDLSDILQRERCVLDRLLFRLIEVRLLLDAQETRFLPWAAADVEHTAEAVREAELRRTAGVDDVARRLGGIATPVRLGDLVDRAEPVMRELLAEHGVALGRLLDEVQREADHAAALAERGLERLEPEQQIVDALLDDGAGPDAGVDPDALALDLELAGVAYSTALMAVGWVPLPSLREFLGAPPTL
jgi:hypothetical protein